MVMVTLFCAIVGEGSIIGVDIDDQQSILALKKRITEEAKYSFASHKLNLYLAKENGDKSSTWMKDDDGDLVQLQEATIPEDIEQKHLKTELLLKPTGSIEDSFKRVPKKDVIHVLVDIRGKDHVSVAVANVNSPLLPGGKKTRGENVLDIWKNSMRAISPSTVIHLLYHQLGLLYYPTLLWRKSR